MLEGYIILLFVINVICVGYFLENIYIMFYFL